MAETDKHELVSSVGELIDILSRYDRDAGLFVGEGWETPARATISRCDNEKGDVGIVIVTRSAKPELGDLERWSNIARIGGDGVRLCMRTADMINLLDAGIDLCQSQLSSLSGSALARAKEDLEDYRNLKVALLDDDTAYGPPNS